MSSITEDSAEVVKAIIKYVLSGNLSAKANLNQLKTGMMPYISNAIFQRENEVLEQERLRTLVALARVFDDEQVGKAMSVLKYSLVIKKT